jgi:F0F1-type ATP synthase assembly protein I
MLSDLGSWASIIGLLLSFGAGFGVCKITIKKSTQENKNTSFFHKGDNNQNNSNSQ